MELLCKLVYTLLIDIILLDTIFPIIHSFYSSLGALLNGKTYENTCNQYLEEQIIIYKKSLFIKTNLQFRQKN